jgi:hypothetical protein
VPSISDLITLGFAGLGVIGLLAAGATITRSSSFKTSLDLQRGEIADLTASKARLEGELTQLRQRDEQREAELRILRDLATSRTDVGQVAAEMRNLAGVVHRDYTAIMSLFYRNPDQALGAQEARYGPGEPPTR